MGWFERFCFVYTPRGERLHAFSRHARFLGLRFVRRWPKAPPRGAPGEYAASPRLGIRSPASLPAATRRNPAFTQQPSHKPFLQPSNNHTPTITQPRLNHPSCRIQERFRLNHPTSTILQIRQYGDTRNALLVEFLYEYLWNNGIELTCLKKYTCPKRVFTGLLSFADM